MIMGMKDFLVNELVKLTAIPSVSGEEGEILGYLEDCLTSMGLPAVRQRVEDQWYNLIINHRENNRLIITAHVDTLPPLDGIPPRPRVDNGAIWGLGACDDKAGIAIILALLIRFCRELEVLPVTFAFLVDEENTGKGSEYLAQEVSHPWGIVLEPTNLKICHCEAGSLEIEFIAKGKMAHGSEVEKGENAIDKALKVIEGLRGLSFLGTEHPFLGESLMNILQITGGDGTLRIPEACRVLIDFRILPQQDIEKSAQEIVQLLEKSGVEYRFADVSLPYELSPQEWIVQALSRSFEIATGNQASLGGMKSWTDAAHLVEGGVRPVVFGPGSLHLCHTPMENVDIQELWLAYKTLEALLEDLIPKNTPS